jgi:hypothetical protein
VESLAGDERVEPRTRCVPAGIDIDRLSPARPPRNALAPMAPRQPLQRAATARRGPVRPTPADPAVPDGQEHDRVRPPSLLSALSVGSRLDDDLLHREDRMPFDGPQRMSALRPAPPLPSTIPLETAPWPTAIR